MSGATLVMKAASPENNQSFWQGFLDATGARCPQGRTSAFVTHLLLRFAGMQEQPAAVPGQTTAAGQWGAAEQGLATHTVAHRHLLQVGVWVQVKVCMA